MDENYQLRLDSEKARAIVWFAVLAIIATVRVTVQENDLWNFPCNFPCPHLSLYAASILTNWIYFWLGYGGCMLVYFSEDWFQRFGQQGRVVREIARRVGNRVFLYFYPLTVVWFSATQEGSFLLPNWIQNYYWLVVAPLWGFLVIWTIEGVIGRKIVGKRGMIGEALDLAFNLGKEGAGALGESLVRMAKRVWSGVRHKPPGPITLRSVKLADRLFLIGLIIVEIAVTWAIAGSTLSIQITVLGVVLYLFMFGLIFIGLLRRKDKS